mgnify:CR=1 FL=1
MYRDELAGRFSAAAVHNSFTAKTAINIFLVERKRVRGIREPMWEKQNLLRLSNTRE